MKPIDHSVFMTGTIIFYSIVVIGLVYFAIRAVQEKREHKKLKNRNEKI